MQLLKFDIPGVLGRLTHKTWVLQRSYNWQLMMPSNIQGILGAFVSQYCQDVKFGNYSINELSTVQYGAFQRFYAGAQSISTINLTFIAPVDGSVYDYFKEWRKLAIDDYGRYYPKMNYSKRIYICLYDTTGIQSVQFDCLGVFPKSSPIISPTYDGDNVLRYEVELSVDGIAPSSFIGGIMQGAVKLVGSALGGGVSKALGF